MAVMTSSQKTSDSKGQDVLTKKSTKYHHKTRPITATLEHPLILDIKLLKKLDMTTFTKKGLIALSKFCGISLINKTDTKKKLNKCVKTIQYSKKQISSDCNEPSVHIFSESNKNFRTKRKLGKHIAKTKPRIKFKIPKEENSQDEDSLDVICKNHSKVLKACNQGSGADDKSSDRKSVIDSILNQTIENIFPEPCKTCNRSEHPERFHSHPKTLMRFALQEKSNEQNLEEKFKDAVTTKDTEKSEKIEMKKIPSAKKSEGESSEEGASPCEEHCEKNTLEKINCSKFGFKSLTKNSLATEMSETGGKMKSKSVHASLTPSSSSTKPKSETLKKANFKIGANRKEDSKVVPGEDDIRFVTGCYICGKQISPKLRIKHEKNCLLEWRTQNSLTSSDKRKSEPKRPDYRFTASGDLDCEGTFESIWANHMDSLVPCKKCGRKFFPDRIERHENCCNNLPISIKHRH